MMYFKYLVLVLTIVYSICHGKYLDTRDSVEQLQFQAGQIYLFIYLFRERSGSVVERLTRDRRAAGSSLTGVTALCP